MYQKHKNKENVKTNNNHCSFYQQSFLPFFLGPMCVSKNFIKMIVFTHVPARAKSKNNNAIWE